MTAPYVTTEEIATLRATATECLRAQELIRGFRTLPDQLVPTGGRAKLREMLVDGDSALRRLLALLTDAEDSQRLRGEVERLKAALDGRPGDRGARARGSVDDEGSSV